MPNIAIYFKWMNSNFQPKPKWWKQLISQFICLPSSLSLPLPPHITPCLDHKPGCPGWEHWCIDRRKGCRHQPWFCFLTTLHCMWNFLDQGSNPYPLQWKCRVWTPGRPRKPSLGSKHTDLLTSLEASLKVFYTSCPSFVIRMKISAKQFIKLELLCITPW